MIVGIHESNSAELSLVVYWCHIQGGQKSQQKAQHGH